MRPIRPHGYIESLRDDVAKLNLAFQPVEVDGASDLERAFAAVAPDAGTGLATSADVMFYANRKRMAELALAQRLPAIFQNEEFVRVGGLISYGTDVAAIFRRSAVYVDKILRGQKASDLPVEQPVLFRLFVNLKTARAVGHTISESFLLRADEIIE